MASIQGIGGVFLYSNDANRLAAWYRETLGVELQGHPDDIGYYCVFPTRDVETSQLRENPVFAINHAKEPVRPGGPSYLLNFRVDDLDGFLEELRGKGVTIEEKRLEWERGKHAWIHDPEGNRIELYEEIAPVEGSPGA